MRLPLLVMMATTGCSAVVGSAAESDAQSTSVTGVVVIDRTVGDDSARAEASARFIRVRGAIDEAALKLASAGLDLPPVGQCAASSGPATASHPVQLLDVGAITIESLSSGQRTALAARQVPDVVDLVSGTMYSARVDETSVPSTSDVAVVVSGSTDVPAFSVRAKTPEAPAVRATLDGATIDLVWTPAQAGDTVYVDVGTTRCTFADDGHAVVAASDGDSVVVHRVRREALSIPGLDAGELRFDFARTLTVRR